MKQQQVQPKRAASPPLVVPSGYASAPHPAVPTTVSSPIMMSSRSASTLEDDIDEDAEGTIAPSTSLTYRDAITELKVLHRKFSFASFSLFPPFF
jgi:hypothetical protein